MNSCPSLLAPLPVASGIPIYVSTAQSLILPRLANITTQRVIFNIGVAAYLVNLFLSDSGATMGDIYRLVLVFPASTNPSTQIKDSVGGNISSPIAGSGYAYQTVVEATFNGVTWEVDDQSA